MSGEENGAKVAKKEEDISPEEIEHLQAVSELYDVRRRPRVVPPANKAEEK